MTGHGKKQLNGGARRLSDFAEVIVAGGLAGLLCWIGITGIADLQASRCPPTTFLAGATGNTGGTVQLALMAATVGPAWMGPASYSELCRGCDFSAAM